MDNTLNFTKSTPPNAPTLELTVVVPCFNEGDIIEPLVRDWNTELLKHTSSFEMIIINDGSSDGSGRILDRLRRENKSIRVIHQLNSGHGRSVRRGYEAARGRFILQVDANGCYDSADFDRLWTQREASLVLAQRTRRIDGLLDQLLAFFTRTLGNLLFGTDLKDPNVSFRLFRREALFSQLRLLNGAADSLNCLLAVRIASERGMSVREVQVPFRARPSGKTKSGLFTRYKEWTALCRDLVSFRIAAAVYKTSLPLRTALNPG
jgi:dolichol-phosphate mannosyltransferase